MSSQGTGSEISKQDAADLLHKLITESAKVQAVFRGRGSVGAGVIGPVSRGLGNLVIVKRGAAVDDPFLSFDPWDATVFKYGDSRTFPDPSRLVSGAPKFISVLCFVYPDGAQVLLFEIAASF